MTVGEVDRIVRACTHPYPGAFTDFQGQVLTIWSGEPVEETPAGSDLLAIPCRDGYLVADDWEVRA
jgi:methionyl-tRNA formyltransferase